MMEKFMEKISSYNLLNNLLPGATVGYLMKLFIGIDVIQTNIINNLFIYYFLGMVVSRIGSIIIEPICKKIKLLSYADYKSYLVACKNDAKIETLLETNNTYRTFLAGCIFILFIWVYYVAGQQFQLLFDIAPIVTIILLINLFALSYKKQTNYIKLRVEKQTENQS